MRGSIWNSSARPTSGELGGGSECGQRERRQEMWLETVGGWEMGVRNGEGGKEGGRERGKREEGGREGREGRKGEGKEGKGKGRKGERKREGRERSGRKGGKGEGKGGRGQRLRREFALDQLKVKSLYYYMHFLCRTQSNFHGFDVSSLRQEALEEYFKQPVLDTFDVRIVMAKPVGHMTDFLKSEESELIK